MAARCHSKQGSATLPIPTGWVATYHRSSVQIPVSSFDQTGDWRGTVCTVGLNAKVVNCFQISCRADLEDRPMVVESTLRGCTV